MITLEEAKNKYGVLEDFYKNDPKDTVFWTSPVNSVGTVMFSFDRKTLYYLFGDYQTLSEHDRKIFDQENPFWKKFFSDD